MFRSSCLALTENTSHKLNMFWNVRGLHGGPGLLTTRTSNGGDAWSLSPAYLVGCTNKPYWILYRKHIEPLRARRNDFIPQRICPMHDTRDENPLRSAELWRPSAGFRFALANYFDCLEFLPIYAIRAARMAYAEPLNNRSSPCVPKTITHCCCTAVRPDEVQHRAQVCIVLPS